jgi:hypothetical protein
MARISAIGVKRVAKGVLVAASVGQDSETLSGDEGESMMHSDNGTDETGETVAVNVVTITK